MVGAVCFSRYTEIIEKNTYQLSKVVVATWVLSISDTETAPETH